MVVGVFFHILAAVFWVGGMLFAHAMLRPAALALEPPLRLALWRRVFTRFFPAVWIAILALLASGYGMVFYVFGGFGHLPLYIDVMQGIGVVMTLIFAHLFFAPWRRFRRAVDTEDYSAAGAQLAQIRRIVGLNLVLGLIVVVVGATGRYWS